ERSLRRGLGRCAVDGPQVFGELGPVGLARVAEAVSDQVQQARLHDRARPNVADRLRQTSEAVADDDADVDRAPVQDLGEDLMPALRPLAAVADPQSEDVALAGDADADDGVDGAG